MRSGRPWGRSLLRTARPRPPPPPPLPRAPEANGVFAQHVGVVQNLDNVWEELEQAGVLVAADLQSTAPVQTTIDRAHTAGTDVGRQGDHTGRQAAATGAPGTARCGPETPHHAAASKACMACTRLDVVQQHGLQAGGGDEGAQRLGVRFERLQHAKLHLQHEKEANSSAGWSGAGHTGCWESPGGRQGPAGAGRGPAGAATSGGASRGASGLPAPP